MFFTRNRSKSSIKEIIVHAGLHKTGTTSIQETLSANAALLQQRGFLYPACWPSNHSIPIFGAFTSNKAFFENIVEGRSRREIRDSNKRWLEAFEQEAAEAKQSRIILSGENISLLSLRELKRFRKFLRKAAGGQARVRVLISVRHPLPWLVSATQQRLKAGQNLQQVLEEKMTDILPRLFRTRVGNLARVFGRDAVEVFRFEDSVKHECGPAGYFLHALGFNQEEISKFDIVKANESISLIAGDMLAYINEKCPIIVNGQRNERRTREDIDPLLAVRGPKFDIPYAYKQGFLEMVQEDLLWLRETFGLELPCELSSPPSDPQLVFNPETIADIQHAYNNSTMVIKELMAEYLRVKLQDKIALINISNS